MTKELIFTTYNELNKQFEVHAVQVSQNEYQIKLIRRSTKPSKSLTLADVNRKLDVLIEVVTRLEARVAALEARIDNLVAKNNLIE